MSSLILAIDTCIETCSAALLKLNTKNNSLEVLASKSHNIAHKQAEKLFSLINYLFKKTHLSYQNLSYIALSTGPGSFTGIRIGISAIQGIFCARKFTNCEYSLNKSPTDILDNSLTQKHKLSTQLRCIPFSTLQIIAQKFTSSTFNKNTEKLDNKKEKIRINSILYAGKDEVYKQLFEIDNSQSPKVNVTNNDYQLTKALPLEKIQIVPEKLIIKELKNNNKSRDYKEIYCGYCPTISNLSTKEQIDENFYHILPEAIAVGYTAATYLICNNNHTSTLSDASNLQPLYIRKPDAISIRNIKSQQTTKKLCNI
jgi:tRNA A37 threonylcarbamoyladenosine modification protein TsaB